MTVAVASVPFADLAAEAQLAGHTGAFASELMTLRRNGFERFAAVGFPTSKDEDWRFTPVRELATARFTAPAPSADISSADLAPFLVGGANGPLLVLVDGVVAPELSRLIAFDSHNLFGSLAQSAAEGRTGVSQFGQLAPVQSTPFAALNTALWVDGAFLHVGRGQRIREPIQILYVTTSAAAGAAISPRTLIVLEQDADACVVETFATLADTAHFTNACTEISLATGARLEHLRIQRESVAASHIGFTGVKQASGSHYRSFTLAMGGKLARHDLHARLDGSNVETLLYGLYLTHGEQLVDNHTAILHEQPHCNSWEVYKGVLADRSRAVFNGKVIVRPEAQKTDAKQTNRNLLLSDDARVDTKPQLEIFADDVKCTHGATVGQLDEQQRFYLRSRGIAGRAAQALLIWAFAAEVLAAITNSTIRETLERTVRAELDALIA